MAAKWMTWFRIANPIIPPHPSLERASDTLEHENAVTDVMFSRKAVTNVLMNKMTAKYGVSEKTPGGQADIPAPEDIKHGRSAKELRDRLDLIEKII